MPDSKFKPDPWNYTGGRGPAHWGTLDPCFSLCGSGRQQSPINIRTASAVPSDLPPLELDYAEVPLDVVNTGNQIQCAVPSGSTMRIGVDELALVQFHFHCPSEHTLDREATEMEMHLVHESRSGRLAVVGVMFRAGETRSALDPVWQHAPAEHGARVQPADVTVDLRACLPSDLGYYEYEGSLTVPPCTEGVTWYLLREPCTLSTDELRALTHLHPDNSRPVQPLNGRVVQASR